MRSGYVGINNYSKLGQMGISHRAFETIASIAANKVQGASVKKTSSRLFNLDKPVSTTIRKDGRVDIHLDVVLRKKTDVNKVCLEIQEEVTNSITMMCETIPFKVQIKVVSVK
jgi:uncharacterized alkaline shock family protein YloU